MLPHGLYRVKIAFLIYKIIIFWAIPHNSKCRYGERGAADAKPKAQIILESYRAFWQRRCRAAAKTPSLLLTVLGLDNFAQAAGLVTMDFACVGEWFLGSILFLYLLFPLLRWGLRKQPLLTWAVVLAASLPVHYMGWDARLVAIHIPEFLLGMAFVHWKRPARLGVLAGCAVLLFTPAAADGKVACALFSAAAFILLATLGGCIHWVPLQNACALLSKYSYAVFLTHHVIILRLVDNFDLAAMTRRDTALLFGVYLLAVAAASAALFRLDAWVRSSAVKLAAKPE